MLAIQVFDPAFHTGLSLWLQAPLFLLLLLVAGREWLRHRSRPLPRRSHLALAGLIPLVLALVLPQADYHFSGHEGAYAELLSGVMPQTADLSSHRTFALPAGLAWAMGRLLPERLALTLWLVGNRVALGLLLVLAAESSATLYRRLWAGDSEVHSQAGGQLAGLLALAALCLSPSLLGWSATGFAIVPALALGLLSLRLGLGGRPALALAFGALALGTRMETAPLVLAGLLLCPADRWRASADRSEFAGLCAGLGLFALQALTLSQKSAGPPLEGSASGVAVALENLGNLSLGGPVLSPGAASLGLLLVLGLAFGQPLGSVGLGRIGGRWEGVVLGLALAAALAQPLFLVDVGARHLQPAVLLAILLLAPSAVAAWNQRSRNRSVLRVICVLLGGALLVPGLLGLRELDLRYMTGFAAVPSAWHPVLAQAPRGSASDILGSSCYTVLPGGGQSWEGAADTMDVREVHRAAQQRLLGRCVLWGVDNDFEFSGDTRAERLDRAVRTLELAPVAWLDPPPRGDRPWVVLRSEPSPGYAAVRSVPKGNR
jgi:hypothetical protein